MDETTTVAERAGVVRSSTTAVWAPLWSGLSWSGVIAGAFTAVAVTIIFVSLGSGIGFSLASPYSYSPSAGTLTILGALWLVFSQAAGFATGGYVAGRLRRDPAPLRNSEVAFRDGAAGLTVWASGVVISMLLVAVLANKAGNAAGEASLTALSGQAPSIDYFADTLLRPNPQATAGNKAATDGANVGATPGAATGSGTAAPESNYPSGTAANGNAQRVQISRVLLTSLAPNGMSNDDRAYLAQTISARTGMSQDVAQRRVDEVVERIKQAAETGRKAAAYLSFWTFMSLLFGAVCAALGGILGGDLRDEVAIREAIPTSPL
jgi:hypothetical protein